VVLPVEVDGTTFRPDGALWRAALVAAPAPPAFTTKALALRSSLPGSTVQTHVTSTQYVYAEKNVLRPQAGLAVQA
jgi:hypothetical protein